MSTEYTRRPFNMGNTANELHNQPEIRGAQNKESDGTLLGLAAILPAELAIETEDAATSGGVSAVFTEATLSHIITQINSALSGFAEAFEYEGCLVVRTTSTGSGAYIRIMDPVSGFNDSSAVLGLPVHPNPSATVTAGDLLDAPVRPRQQGNPVGTKYLAAGEDRSGNAYNRALQQLGINTDQLYTWAKKPIAKLLDVRVDAAAWSSFIDYDADGRVDQINLSGGLASLLPSELARVYVGGLSASSTLEDIAKLFEVLDDDHNELMAQETTVRVSAVTRGQRGAARPVFADAVSAPSPGLSDTSGVAVDGNNALGVDRVKHAATQIDEVRQHTVVFCESATFVTNGVKAGDVATIAGSTVDVPFNHTGVYLVDVVVSEQELILRPHHDEGHVQALNDDVSGDFGTVTITASGEWERDIWLTFEPPIPRVPEDGFLRLVVPMETSLADILPDAIAGADIRVYEEADGWVLYNLWQQQSFGGVYQGQNHANGGGYRGEVTHRPITLVNRRTMLPAAGTTVRSSTSDAEWDGNTNYLTAGATDRFNQSDVGKTILLAHAGLLSDEPWTIVKWFDGATVEIAPPIFRTGIQAGVGAATNVTWTIIEDDAFELQSVMQALVPEYFGTSNTEGARAGFTYVREQRSEATSDDLSPGALSFLHLEKIRHHDDGTKTNINTFEADIAGDTLTVDFEPEQSSNIFAASGDAKTLPLQGGITYARILHGPNRGFYQVKAVTSISGSGTNTLTLQHLDGATPTFTTETEVSCCLYNARVAAGAQIYGGPNAASGGHGQAALSLFEDGHAAGAVLCAALRLNWRGLGYGLYGVINDPEYIAHANGDAAEGTFIYGHIYAPSRGIEMRVEGADDGDSSRRQNWGIRVQAHTSLHDANLNVPGEEGVPFSNTSNASFAAYFGQTGDDPSVLIAKQEEGSVGDEDWNFSKVTASVALGVMRARSTSTDNLVGPTGRGSAVEVVGSVWVYRRDDPTEEQSVFAEGGLFVEDTVGAGRWLYPMIGAYKFGEYWGVPAPNEGWAESTRLGHPGTLVPSGVADSSPEGELLVPDYADFNFTHMGRLRVTGALAKGVSPPFNRYVGCRLVVGTGTKAGHDYAIVGVVMTAEDEPVFCLHADPVTDLVTGSDTGTVDFEITGARWHQAHLNISDWALVGTWDPSLEWSQLPVVLADTKTLQDRVTGNPSALVPYPALGFTSPVVWAPATAGATISEAPEDVASMSNVAVEYWNYVGEWTGTTADTARYRHGWSRDADEPRSPFPNAASDADGTFRVGEYKLRTVSGAPTIAWSEKWGGCLEVDGVDGATCQVIQRGRTYLLTKHFRLLVSIKAAVRTTDASVPVTVKLINTATFAEVASSSSIVMLSNGSIPQTLEHEFVLEGLEYAHADELAAGQESTSLSVAFEFELPASALMNVLELRTRTTTRPLMVGAPLVVHGAVGAHGFRLINPVLGHQPIGPAEVSLLGGHDYNGNLSWPTWGYAGSWVGEGMTGTQELRCGPGLVRSTGRDAYSFWLGEIDYLLAGWAGDIDTYATELADVLDSDQAAYSHLDVPRAPHRDDVLPAWEAANAALSATDPAEKSAWLSTAVALTELMLDKNIGKGGSNAQAYRADVRGVIVAGDGAEPLPDGYTELLAAKPGLNWIRPHLDASRLFTKGVNSATVTFYNGVFDPLWYAVHAHWIRNHQGETNTIEGDAFIPCGMTGFLAPLNPPHGSILTELNIGLGIRPHDGSRVGLWYDVPAAFKDLNNSGDQYTDVALLSEWNDLQGVLVEVWRHNTVDFGVVPDNFAAWSDHQAEFGFGELIHSEVISISNDDIPATSVNTVEDAWERPSTIPGDNYMDIRVRQEMFIKRTISLPTDSRGRVDRRQYAYMLVVRAYGGMRRDVSSHQYPYTRGESRTSYNTGDSRWELPQEITRYRGSLDDDDVAVEVEAPIYGTFETNYWFPDTEGHDINEPFRTTSFPPQLKFRGARLTWLTDRAGDGGWGS